MDELSAQWQTQPGRLMDEAPVDLFFRRAVDTILAGLQAVDRTAADPATTGSLSHG